MKTLGKWPGMTLDRRATAPPTPWDSSGEIGPEELAELGHKYL